MNKKLGYKVLSYKKLISICILVGISSNGYSAEGNLITNSDFSDGSNSWQTPQWWTGGDGFTEIDAQGRLCTTVTKLGRSSWGAQLRQDNLNFIKGETYKVSMKAWVSTPIDMRISAVDESDGFIWIFGSTLKMIEDLNSDGQQFDLTYTASNSSTDNGMFRFLYGAGEVPLDAQICVDDIIVDGYKAEPEPEPELQPESINVMINQIGYLPYASKKATYKLQSESDFQTPRAWTLISDQEVVATGNTEPQGNGLDSASGDFVHQIDFSEYQVEGENYTLMVEDGSKQYKSHTFPIKSDVYKQVKSDAMAYFYHNRSGTPIESNVVGEAWSRPAGHESDASVETFSCLTDNESCTQLDASGGWYDAGDHGKYVVNGGISTWTLLNLYERFKHLTDNSQSLADGTLALPSDETANGIPDILDEAAWEIKWMLKMQVASDQEYAGMVYHKIHDNKWTGIPLAPDEDLENRSVYPVSTAATLNFAAIAAQCYRVYIDFDTDLANRCLEQAEIAYAAALNHPNIYALKESIGGGAYEDSNVSDEFYWAATELYITTEKQSYSKDMQKSPLHLSLSTYTMTSMNWQSTKALGLISIATARNPDYSWTKKTRALLIAVADKYVSVSNSQGYGISFSSNYYPWGSNASVVNNMIVLGLAYDFTKQQKYIDAMLQSSNYIFGNNPLSQSYVTGYGTTALKYPHHRFWAEVVNSNYPPAPAGALSGGPNSSLQDDYASSMLKGCSPQKCFVDNISAWSVNEVTINWNAPLAWVTAYLDDYAYNNQIQAQQ